MPSNIDEAADTICLQTTGCLCTALTVQLYCGLCNFMSIKFQQFCLYINLWTTALYSLTVNVNQSSGEQVRYGQYIISSCSRCPPGDQTQHLVSNRRLPEILTRGESGVDARSGLLCPDHRQASGQYPSFRLIRIEWQIVKL